MDDDDDGATVQRTGGEHLLILFQQPTAAENAQSTHGQMDTRNAE